MDIPIIFSAPMVRALLEGRKTMTRRLRWIGRKAADGEGFRESTWARVKPGDRLWVRENHQFRGADYGDSGGDIEWFRVYGGDGASDNWDPDFPESWEPSFHMAFRKLTDPGESEGADVTGYVTKLLPSIHMPRWASRLTLVVTAAKIERLQDISKTDVIAEGIAERDGCPITDVHAGWHEPFAQLWDSLNGDGAWDANPEVVALTFTVHTTNIDALPKAEAAYRPHPQRHGP